MLDNILGNPVVELLRYATVIIPLWALSTGFALAVLNWLTPWLPFKKIKDTQPWIIVVILAIAGACTAYLLKSYQVAVLSKH